LALMRLIPWVYLPPESGLREFSCQSALTLLPDVSREN